MKSTIEKITQLELIADMNKCDGDCDLFKPYIKCKGCKATTTLNEIGEILSDE